jgi:hypothetical protein
MERETRFEPATSSLRSWQSGILKRLEAALAMEKA